MSTSLEHVGTTLLAAFVISLHSGSVLAQPSAGNALTFDGVDDVVVVPSHPLLELTDGTLELWFQPDWAPGSIAYDPALIANRLGPNLTRYSLHIDRNLAGVILANGTSVSTVPFSFTRGEWFHLALVESGSTGQVFVNGKLVGSTANGFGTLIGLPLNLGSDGTGQFFLGQMDEVRIWSVARSAVDLRYNISRALAGTEAGLVAYWRMDEGLGTVIADATGNRLDGMLYGPEWSASPVVQVNTSGSLGMALELVASRNTYVEVNSDSSLALGNQFTIEAWIKPRTAKCNTILARGDGNNLYLTDYIFQVGTDGANCGVMKIALMVNAAWATSAAEVPLNAWSHVAASYDGTTKRFYINGLLDQAITETGGPYQSSSPVFIGRQGTSGGNYFDGTLDEVRVWTTARSAFEIQNNLNRRLSGNNFWLAANWRFDETSGAGAFDYSGGSNNGRLFNRPLRVPSFWAPMITLNGANPLLQECHVPFSDPGATANGFAVGVAAGYEHSVTLRPNGTVFSWGRNDNGQTNIPPSATGVVAVAAGGDHSVALRSDGTVIAWGSNYDGRTNVPSAATNVVAIATGGSHSLALRSDGTVIGWGSSSSGQINVPPFATNVVAIAAGNSHSLALRSDGTVIAWGYNGDGQINVPPTASNMIAIAAGGAHSLALRRDGIVIPWGYGGSGQTTIPSAATNIIAIAAGTDHSLALRADGAVIGWGGNGSGQANTPSAATNVVAIAAGDYQSLALRADGIIIGWGRNNYSEGTIHPGVTNLSSVAAMPVIFDVNAFGTYALTYSTTNRAGAVATATRTILVRDTQPPALTILGTNPLNVNAGTPFIDPGAIATDSCEGNLTTSIVRTGSVDATEPNSYTLEYSVSDSSGNRAAATRIVFVRGAPAVLGFNAFFSGTNVITGSPIVQFLAEVDPNGLATVTYAAYGLTTAYPGRTALVNLPTSYDLSTFYATLDGLMPGLTYHFRIAASNSLGVAYGPDQMFTVPLLFSAGDLNGDGRVDQAELDRVLSNYWPSSSWLVMTNAITLCNGLFQFELTNASAWNFTVLASSNLLDWSPLPDPAWPAWQFVDPAATNQPHRFYRLRWP